MIKNIAYSTLLCAVLLACSTIPKEAYFTRGTPEALLDVSSEVVNVRLDSPGSIQELTRWVNQDQPSRAELVCPDGDSQCTKARNVLNQFGVPVQYTSAADNNVALVYERVMARDCENRYIDNTVNPYNLSHPTFGCSTAANMVQMVGDKRQFTSPALMDYTDARKAFQAADFYAKPNSFTPAKVDLDFKPLATPENISSSGSGGGGGGGASR